MGLKMAAAGAAGVYLWALLTKSGSQPKDPPVWATLSNTERMSVLAAAGLLGWGAQEVMELLGKRE
jgi:hypothetical protein